MVLLTYSDKSSKISFCYRLHRLHGLFGLLDKVDGPDPNKVLPCLERLRKAFEKVIELGLQSQWGTTRDEKDGTFPVLVSTTSS